MVTEELAADGRVMSEALVEDTERVDYESYPGAKDFIEAARGHEDCAGLVAR